jgi:hypothetical protein
MSTPIPSYADGITAITDLSAVCLNNSKTYICFDGDPGEGAEQKRFTNQNGNLIGSVTHNAAEEGTLNLQLTLSTDPLPRPGYVILFRSKYYVVGKVSPKFVQNGEVKFSVAVLVVANPIISTLLSTVGQLKEVNWTEDAAITAINCAAVNAAAGSLTWAMSGAPAGVSINAGTGAITGTPTEAGVFNITVTVTDTDGKVGVGYITADVAAA